MRMFDLVKGVQEMVRRLCFLFLESPIFLFGVGVLLPVVGIVLILVRLHMPLPPEIEEIVPCSWNVFLSVYVYTTVPIVLGIVPLAYQVCRRDLRRAAMFLTVILFCLVYYFFLYISFWIRLSMTCR